MEPISQKVGGMLARQTTQQPGQKSAPSKFDTVRADLNQKLNAQAQMPEKVTSVSAQEKHALVNDLRAKLQTPGAAQNALQGELNKLGDGIAQVKQQVAAAPKSSALDPLRERLASVEADFNNSANILKSPGNLSDPNRLLEMQVEMYKLSQNVEILSRVVGDVASGVRTMIQTQV